jgi:uncharacterized membrane protein HdeD (DUF308 family)
MPGTSWTSIRPPRRDQLTTGGTYAQRGSKVIIIDGSLPHVRPELPTAALVLIGILLVRNPEVAFARPRVFADPTATAIVFGVAALIGLAAIRVALPTPRDNFTSGKFSDPMLLYFAVPLTIIAAVTQGLLRAAVLAGWTGGAGVLATTVFFRLRPKIFRKTFWTSIYCCRS